MGKKLVKLIAGIGFTSQATHAARSRGLDKSDSTSRNGSVQEGCSEYIVADAERVAKRLKPRWEMFQRGNKKNGRGGFLGKALSQDVLYMLIVNLPNQEEMQASAA